MVHLDVRKEKELWKKAKQRPEDLAQDICDVFGKHTDEKGNDVHLEVEDIIVNCCTWHQGKKDKNPTSFVRFVDRDAHSWGHKNRFNGDDCPMAAERSDEDHRLSTSREFQKNCIRLFCRDPSKVDLLYHKFETLWENLMGAKGNKNTPAPAVDFEYRGLEVQDNGSSGEDSHEELAQHNLPVPLTQESGDEGSPIKSPRSQKDYGSPIPVLKRRF